MRRVLESSWLLAVVLILGCGSTRDENGVLLYENLKESTTTTTDALHPSIWIPVQKRTFAGMTHRGFNYTGQIAKYYDNGNLEFMGYYKNGFKDGTWKYYNDQGILEYEAEEGGCNGSDRTDYHPNGNIRRKQSVRDDCSPALEEEYYANGQLKYRHVFEVEGVIPESYVRKRIDGETVEYYHQDTVLIKRHKGTLRVEEVKGYSNGILHGESLYYHENGVLRKRENYNNGNMDGAYQEFYENGQIAVDGFFKSSIRDGVWAEYYSDGTLRLKSFMEFGKLVGRYEEYHSNGNAKIIANYTYDLLDGEYSELYENGQVKKRGRFRGDHKMGIWKHYSETGVLTKSEEL